MSLSFLTPGAALIGLAVVPAVLVALAARRRSASVASSIGLQPAGRRGAVVDLALIVGVAVCVSLAAAQPVVSATGERRGRDGTEVIVVMDVTRSMLAQRAPGEPQRIERARALAKELRVQLPDVRFGVSSITDRVLPHLFPTLSANAFAATVDRAVGIERPPPDRRAKRATALAALGGLGRAAFYDPTTVNRVAVVVTDGESIPADLGALRARLEQGGVSTYFLHVWRPDERIFAAEGTDASYRPDPATARGLARIAGAIDARVYGELEVRRLAQDLRRLSSGEGLVRQATELEARELAPYAAALAALPLLLLLWRRVG